MFHSEPDFPDHMSLVLQPNGGLLSSGSLPMGQWPPIGKTSQLLHKYDNPSHLPAKNPSAQTIVETLVAIGRLFNSKGSKQDTLHK